MNRLVHSNYNATRSSAVKIIVKLFARAESVATREGCLKAVEKLSSTRQGSDEHLYLCLLLSGDQCRQQFCKSRWERNTCRRPSWLTSRSLVAEIARDTRNIFAPDVIQGTRESLIEILNDFLGTSQLLCQFLFAYVWAKEVNYVYEADKRALFLKILSTQFIIPKSRQFSLNWKEKFTNPFDEK